MDIKQILAALLANADKIQPQDAELLTDLASSYELEVEAPEQDPAHEAQETPTTEQLEHETNVELGEPLGEVQEGQEQGEGQVPPQGEVPVVEPIVEEPQVEVQQEVAPDPMQSVLSEITSLRTEIEALKSALSKVALTEEVKEDEDKEDVGAMGKSTNGIPANKPSDVQEQLLRKFGGRAG